MSAVARVLCVVAAFALLAAPSATPASSPATRQVVAYTSRADLDSLADSGVRVLRTLPALHSAVVETSRPLGQQPVVRRELTVEEPALAQTYLPGVAWEWQWDAAEMEAVPDRVLRAAARVKIAVIDSGADLGAPDIRDKDPRTWSVLSRSHRVRDVLGHGTFVSSLAAGSVDERGRRVRVRGRREAAGRPGDRARRLRDRRRGGGRDRLRRQARREDHQPLDRRRPRARGSSAGQSTTPRGTAF